MACFRAGTPLQISMYTHPSVASAKILYWAKFLRGDGKGNFHILIPVHRCVVIDNIYVQCEEPGIGCRHCTIYQALSRSQTGARCGGDTEKIQFVATHSDTHYVCFSLVGSDTGHKSGVGDFAASWNVAATNKKYCVSASGNACAKTLYETAEVVGKAVGPDVLIWPSCEVSVFQVVAVNLVDDRVGHARGIVGYKGDRWLVCAVGFQTYRE